jgi:hypothetical protein
LKRVLLSTLMILCALAVIAAESHADGHFMPGVMSIRDYVVPDPGFYGVLYNYYYTTNRMNDSGGNKLESVKIGPRQNVTINVDVSVDLYAVAPALIWVSDWKIFGAKYAAYIAPTFANSSLSGALSTMRGRGISDDTSTFNVGDMQVMPVWLGWTMKNWDVALSYSFYAPIGKYTTVTETLPIADSVTYASPENTGLGFWTHQFQNAVSWYPWADKRMAVATALTYEINQNKQGFDLTPGQNLTFNYGVSQYIPLADDQKLLLEVGPAGYSSWQITDDTGSDARNPGEHQQVHGVGGQLGLTYVPWNAAMNFRYFYEYASDVRFQGQSLSLNFAMKF